MTQRPVCGISDWPSLLFSILILVKSQMIVFARVFCARVPFKAATAEEEDEAIADRIGKTTARGSQLEIKAIDGHARYYVAFRACGNNVGDRRRIPAAATAGDQTAFFTQSGHVPGRFRRPTSRSSPAI